MCPTVKKASVIWRSLNGLLCLHKPPEMTFGRLLENVKTIASNGLNELKDRPIRKIVHMPSPDVKIITPDYSDHPLVIGPRYEREDIRLTYTNPLGPRTSGVFVLGFNHGRKLAYDLQSSKPTRVYRLMGELGEATDTFHLDGKVMERAKFKHVKRTAIDSVVASIEAMHQRSMFMHEGINLQTQTAYDLAVGGAFRPQHDEIPVIYRIKCVSFESPLFTLEVMCINENEEFLLELIHTVGIKVHSVAKCLKVQCIRYGPFLLEHSLLRRLWNVTNFSQNIEKCSVLDEQDRKSGRRSSPHLVHTPTEVTDEIRSPSAPVSQNDTSSQHNLPRMSRHQVRRRLKRLQSEQQQSN